MTYPANGSTNWADALRAYDLAQQQLLTDISSILGSAPQGTYPSLAARLAALDSAVANGGGGTPATNVVRFVRKNTDGTWPARPTSDGSVMVLWDGPPASDGSGPPTVTTGTGGMRPGDKWLSHP